MGRKMPESELQRIARRNLIFQAVFLTAALLFFVFTVTYAVRFIVRSETNKQTVEMGVERDARLAKRDAILKAQFHATEAMIAENRRTLLELTATVRYAELQRAGRERREMRRFAQLHSAVSHAMAVMDRHDTQIMKDH